MGATLADVTQNPLTMRRMASDKYAATLTTGCNKWMFFELYRLVSGGEWLLSHGFPASPWAVEAYGFEKDWSIQFSAPNPITH